MSFRELTDNDRFFYKYHRKDGTKATGILKAFSIKSAREIIAGKEDFQKHDKLHKQGINIV